MSEREPRPTTGRIIERYRVELLLALLSIVILLSFVAVQHSILDEPAQEAGATAQNFVGAIGAPLDDVYIHCRFAYNLAHGRGYAFNAGEPVTADTSPLWLVLLAASSFVTNDLPLVAIVLSMVCYVLLTVGVYRASRELFGFGEWAAVLAGVCTALSSRLVWSGMSGMETALGALLLFVLVEEHIRNRMRRRLRWREGLWLGLGLITRPEFVFFGAVLVIDLLFCIRREKVDLRQLPLALILTAILGSPLVLLPLFVEGKLVYHSSVVQGAGIHLIPNLAYLWFAFKILASNNVALFLFVVTGIVLVWRDPKLRLLAIIAIGLPVLQSVVAPQFRHHGRYFFPVIPLLVILGIAVLQQAGWTRIWRRLAIVVIVAAGLGETVRWSLLEAEAVRNINDQHLAVAHYLGETLTPSDRLAAHDVGAVAYFTDRSVIDLTGLVSPEMWPVQRDQREVWRKARSEGANVFLIYNRLNPTFYESVRDSLEFVREFRVRKPLVSAADTVMSLYRLRHAD